MTRLTDGQTDKMKCGAALAPKNQKEVGNDRPARDFHCLKPSFY